MGGIRVTYSGIVAFVVTILSIVLGLAFTLMITRSLSPEEFGALSLLISIVGYFLVSEALISYWAIRQIARGEDVGKTGMLSSIGIAGASTPLFVIYASLILQTSISSEVIIIGAVLLVIQFGSQTLTGINMGHKPHATSYSILLFSLLKIAVGVLTILVLHWGILGAVLAILVAYLGKVVFQTCVALPKLQGKMQLPVLTRWIRTSWLPLFAGIPDYLYMLDGVLYSVLTGSVVGVAYYYAAYAIAKISMHSRLVAQALYPKLIEDRLFAGINKNLKLVLYAAIPTTALAIVFAEAGLFILNPIYREVWPVVILLALRGFFYAVRGVPGSILSGTERVDADKRVPFSRLVHSNLFKLPLILTIANAAYIAILVVCFVLLGENEIRLVIAWAAVGLLKEAAITAIIWKRAHKITQLSVPWRSLFKFSLASVSFVSVFYITSPHILNYSLSVYEFLPLATAQALICVGIYLGLTYVIDHDTRVLVKTAYSMLRR